MKPPDFDLWRPWFITWDEGKQRWVRVLKEAHELPIVHELAQDSGFVTRAHGWAWAKEGPTAKAQAPNVWPPSYTSTIQAVGDYWHHLTLGYHMHAPEMLEPTPTTMAEAVAQAKSLSLANPFLIF